MYKKTSLVHSNKNNTARPYPEIQLNSGFGIGVSSSNIQMKGSGGGGCCCCCCCCGGASDLNENSLTNNE